MCRLHMTTHDTPLTAAQMYFVAPTEVRMKDDIKQFLTSKGIPWTEVCAVAGVLCLATSTGYALTPPYQTNIVF
jgi:hypothetical protein